MSSQIRHLSTTDTAKLLRTMLKATYPATKFSVCSRSYSMGSSIDVSWTDGPTKTAVDALVQPIAGADFNGMEDIKEYRGAITVDGEQVHSGCDFIFAQRTLSDAAWLLVATHVAAKFNVPVPARDGAERVYPVIGGHYDFSQYVRTVSNDRTELDRI